MRAHLIVTAVLRLFVCSLVVLTTAPAAWAQTKDARETFVAFAVNMGNVGPTGARTVDITPTRNATCSEPRSSKRDRTGCSKR